MYKSYSIEEIISKTNSIITYDFLKEFRNQLIRMNPDWSIDTFLENGVTCDMGAGVWCVAFSKTCIITNNQDLYKYRCSLGNDSDIFDDRLGQMLIEQHLILGKLSEIIKTQLGIEEIELKHCYDCGKIYTKDMMIKTKDEEESIYRCFNCDDKLNSKNNKQVTDYYLNCLEEINKWRNNFK